MIILDTNVLSEPMRPRPEPRVLEWLDRHDPADLWITAITAAEFYSGIAKLDRGVRRTALATEVEATLGDFRDRALPFDVDAAFVFGELTGPLVARKTKYGVLDFQIASIALLHGAELATRNIKDFVDTGVRLINPWDA